MQVSHETLYTATYAMLRGELRTQVIGGLRFGRSSPPRARGEDRRGRIAGMVSIHDCPPEVEERLIPALGGRPHQGDAQSRGGTLVERTTLFTVRSRVDDASAEAALSGFSRLLNGIEAPKRLWLTEAAGVRV